MLTKKQIDDVSAIPAQALLHHVYMELNNAATQICDKYCKFPYEYDEEMEGESMADRICKNCPLNKLLE